MIHLTGDIHGTHSIRRLSSSSWPEGNSLTREDYLIILGDFGLIWDGSDEDERWLDWLEQKPWTTLFIDGNHENHRLLSEYPEEDWRGGRVHRLRPHIIHLMRGYVFDIPTGEQTKSFLAMGGAHSHDKQYRTEGKSWWPEEVPCLSERLRCERNLKARGWSVDYILTHDAPATVAYSIARGMRIVADEYSEWLDTIAERATYERWYCGHWHMDAWHERLRCEVLYGAIDELGSDMGDDSEN